MQDRRWPTYPDRGVTLDRAADEHENGSLRLRDSTGRTLLDFVAGIGCAPLGHAHPRWRAAIDQQLGALTSVANTFPTEPQRALADRLGDIYPIDNARVFLANSGTEATEAAIKLALKATGRDVIVAFEGAFHGRSIGSISLTANPKYREPYVWCLNEAGTPNRFMNANVLRLPFNDGDALTEAFNNYGDRIAGVFMEPIQGESGIFPATREFLLKARELCNTNGALLGMDEIQSGSGRTGRFSAWEGIVNDEQIQPDIMWLAKSLAGGFPIGACLAKGDVAEAMQPGTHGSTFGGNPTACAAALATLDIIEDEGLLEKASAQFGILESLSKSRPIEGVTQIRGVGAMMGVQIGERSEQRAKTLVKDLLDEDIMVTVCGGHTVRMLPPFRAGEAEIGEVWDALGKVVAKL